jgi:hypothetical protein
MKSKCKVCGAEIEANDLGSLAKLLKKHCKRVIEFVPPRLVPVEVFVPFILFSQNKFHLKHWTVYKRYNDACQSAFNKIDTSPFGKGLPYSEWELYRLYSGREKEFDQANFVGGSKCVPDTLKKLGIIVDDAPKHFKSEYYQVRTDRSGLVLKLTSFDETPQTRPTS